MVLPLKKYPDDSINVNAGPVRSFKDSYKQMQEDIMDTMKEHNLDALSAIEIGYLYQLMVLKIDNEYKTFANPRIITQSEPFISIERTPYLYNKSIETKRNRVLSIVYDDENGDMQTFKIDDEKLAANFHRTLDYLFNATLLDRLKPADREKAIASLAGNYEMPSFADATCPTSSKRQYFVSFADKLLFFVGLSLLMPIFGISHKALSKWYIFDKIALLSVVALMIGFYFYALYEAKKYRQCSSCQIGNNIGVIVKRFIALSILTIAAYIVLGFKYNL